MKTSFPLRSVPNAPSRRRARMEHIQAVIYIRLNTPERLEWAFNWNPLWMVSIIKKGAPIRAIMPSVRVDMVLILV